MTTSRAIAPGTPGGSGGNGDVRYLNLKFGSESEEHPYILQALNMARKLPLPVGWQVKKTITEEGDEDFFFWEPHLGLSGE